MRSADEMHAFLRSQVNAMLRRLGMYGDEFVLMTTFDSLYYLEGDDNGIDELRRSWRDRGAYSSVGPKGALRRYLPDKVVPYAVCSMYAEAARDRGWLELERVLTPGEYRELRASATEFATEDRSWNEVEARFGEPSMLIGGRNPLYGKILAYASEDAAQPMVFFDLMGTYSVAAGSPPPPESVPVLLAIRTGQAALPDAFTFTPEGIRMRPDPAVGRP